MDLGTILSAASLLLLLADLIVIIGLVRLLAGMGGRSGSAIVRVLLRTMVLVAVSQLLILVRDVRLASAPPSPEHFPSEVLGLVSAALVIVAGSWAAIDLRRLR